MLLWSVKTTASTSSFCSDCLFLGDYLSVSSYSRQELLEAARIAEEMAMKAAEEAVRQLEEEQSAKIIIETIPESNEP